MWLLPLRKARCFDTHQVAVFVLIDNELARATFVELMEGAHILRLNFLGVSGSKLISVFHGLVRRIGLHKRLFFRRLIKA